MVMRGYNNSINDISCMIIGIDEAGRGCIIGPMVIAAASIDPMREYLLKDLGVKDSKKLSPKQRETIYPQVLKLCEVKRDFISAEQITRQMDKDNLNEIEAIHIARLLSDAPDDATAFIDSPDNIPANFGKRILKHLKSRPKLVCENKADDKHLIVGAASIVAKVERDREIEKIKEELGVDFNSGYTSDPYTIAFLARHSHEPKVRKYLRLKWATLKNLQQRKIMEY
ncbi:MAG: ribonuclease HII [Candidatus Micrarchaeota archaeon]